MTSLTLRLRIVLGYLGFGAVMSLVFAVVAWAAFDDFEHILVRELLHVEAENFVARFREHPDLALPASSRIFAYVREPDGSGNVPERFTALEPGIHEDERDAHGATHVAVYDVDQRRLYFVIDLAVIEEREEFLRALLIGVVILGSLLSAWAGFLLAGRLIRPVHSLARAVDDMPVEPSPTEMAAGYADDEVGRLARAFDRYRARLAEFVQHERAFTRDASHELRTPLAVMQAAVDVLLDDPSASPRQRRNAERVHRGLDDLLGLLDALLVLGRDGAAARERVAPVNLRQVCVDVVEQQAGALGARGIRVHVIGSVDDVVHAPPRVLAVAIGQILRQLCGQVARGSVTLQAEGSRVVFWPGESGSVALDAAPHEELPSDTSLGTAMVRRVCAKYGWALRVATEGSPIVLELPETATPHAVDEAR